MASKIVPIGLASCRQGVLGATASAPGMALRMLGRLPRLSPPTTQMRAPTPPHAVSLSLVSRFSSSSSSSSFSSCPRMWILAVAIPLMLSPDTEQATTPSPLVSSNTDRQRPLRTRGYRPPMDPDVAAQVSKGSLTGFVIGILVSFFSRTLVLVLGLAITLQSLASKAGINLVRDLHLKEKISSSKILSALSENTAFKLAFGVTFTMTAFMHF